MDELKVLRDWDAGTGPPREAARLAARDRLLGAVRAETPAAAQVRAPASVPLRPGARAPLMPVRGPGGGGMSRRTVVRGLVAAGATVASVGTPLALLERGGDGGPAGLPPAEVLRRAAELERERERMRPPIEPRRGQYVYSRVFVREMPDDSDEETTFAKETWLAADPSQRSWLSNAREASGWRRSEKGSWPPADWRTVSRIPTEPEALLTHVSSYGARRTPEEFDRRDWTDAYFFLGGLLGRIPVLPDGLLPAVLTALAGFPDRTLLPGAEDARGRAALGIAFPDDTGTSRYLLFAADTSEYLGMQNPRTDGPNSNRIFTQLSYLDAYAVVDEVRERP
ncbi:hypothetical protein [Streptomyces sp. 184]|uniref:hypothetical protein n=1 Tax=Streptomyces sp. 184 TaxID=1827526 RepID=UPI0038927AFD